MTDRFHPMATAPHDGTIVDLRHVSRAHGEMIFRARWLAPLGVWVDWDRQHVTLDKAPLRGWRVSETQYRAWTPQEEAILAELHGPPGTRFLDFDAWQQGIRVPVAERGSDHESRSRQPGIQAA
jgi:hypothetical protein